MFKNYLNTVLRGIGKYKVYSAINILGLATGITCCLLILLYVHYEYSYDQYHEKADRIYRVTLRGVLAGNEINAATTPYPMAAALMNEYPEVESATRFRQFFQPPLVSLDNLAYQETQVFHGDPQFFEIFTFPFLVGEADSALAEPNTVVISETMVQKYFPDSDALGQVLTFNSSRDYRITGVIADVPDNSHFHPDFIVSFSSDSDHDSPIWVSNNIQTYLLVREGSSGLELEQKLDQLVDKYVAPQIEQVLGASLEEFRQSGGEYGYRIQALQDIHLYSDLEGEIEAPGSAAYVLTFQAVALFILSLACINFMNLSTARSAIRAREIGVRKVMGATREQLIGQFLAESVIISMIALGIALILVVLLLPSFNGLTDRQMNAAVLFNPPGWYFLVGFGVLVGIVSGSYPALFLSRFHPQVVLKGKFSTGIKTTWLRRGLVVFQFVISVALVAATLIVFDQLEYLRNKPLGFEKEQLLVVHRSSALGDQLESFKNQIRQLPNVQNITSAADLPGYADSQNALSIEGRPGSEAHVLATLSVGYDFVETMKIEFVQGRPFSRNFGSTHPGYIINESAVREMNLENPLETRLVEPDPDGARIGQVIGVVKDFHYQSLHQEIKPMVLRVQDFSRFVVVRIAASDMQATINAVENKWHEMTSRQPFVYTFLDADFDELHRGDFKMGQIFIGFSSLAVFIACLGLYSLTSFSTLQRTKEIGIRKTAGASVADIVILLSREFMILVLGAIVIAIPAAFLSMNLWLQLFTYRIGISPLAFAVSSLLALFVAFLTVGYQSVIAATKNPVLALRIE